MGLRQNLKRSSIPHAWVNVMKYVTFLEREKLHHPTFLGLAR
jgi:hypothetical protein